MESNSRRCIIGRKIINGKDRNLVFTKARFTIRDNGEKIQKLFTNPNVLVVFAEDTERCDECDATYYKEHYPSIRDRIYEYRIVCYVIKEECPGVIVDITNIDFIIEYNNFLNFLEDKPIWDKR